MTGERPLVGKLSVGTAHTWFCFMGAALATALCPLAANADTETVGGIEWTYQVEGSKAIVGKTVEEYREEWGGTYSVCYPAIPTNTVGAVTIPSTLGGYPVTGINESAFEDCALVTAITIPNGVEKIGSYAFAWCDKLAKVTIPASVAEIEEDAFPWTKLLTTITLDSRNKSFVYSGNMLLSADKKRILAVSRAATSISIPNGVTKLPYGLLGGCVKLKTVTIPASVEDTSDGWNDALGSDTCTSLTTIKVDAKNPAVKVVNSLLISKDDPAYVEYVPAGLTTVTIPASVRFFDLDTAVKCAKLVVDANNPYYKGAGGCILSKDGTTFVAAPPAMKDVVVPTGVKTIATYAFLYSSGATVTIPASVTQLGDDENEYTSEASVFGCDVKSIRFLGNPPLTLWKNPFISLKTDWDGEIRVSTYSADDWRDYFFLNVPFLYGKVVGGLPGEPVFKYVSRYDYNWGDAEDGEYESDGGDGIVITGGSNIKGAVTIPVRIDGNLVTGIGRKAFKKNKNITAVAIPDTVNRIGYNAFGSCTALKSVTIAGGESVDMGQFSFSGCSGLAKGGFAVVNGVLYHYTGKGGVVTIPSTVRIIDDEVFRNNKKVTAVNLPSSVREIRSEAFEYCTKLTRVTCAEGVERLGSNVFLGCTALARFNIPASIDLWESANRWGDVVWMSRKLKSLTIADMENMGWTVDYLVRGAKLNASVSVAFDPVGGPIDGLEDDSLLDEKGVAHVSVPYLDALWSVLPDGLYKPTRKGFTFQGWYTAKAKGTKISVNTTVSKAVTYYAQWKPNKYKVTVKAGAGGKVAKSGSYTCGSTVKFTATPNKGYVFVRWDDAEFSEYHEGDYEVLWTNYMKQRRVAPLSLKIPPGDLTLTAVFAKSSEDAAAPVVALSGRYISWNLEEDPDLEIPVWVTGSLSFAPLKAVNLPPGVGLVLVEDSEEYGTQYLLKVTDPAKLKPGSWNLKLSATNRAGKKSNTIGLAIVGRNVTAAVGKAVEGLETSTTNPYVFQGGVKSSFKLADLGATAINGWKLAKITGMPAGWTFKNGTVSGVATPGTYTLFFTFANGKKTVQASATFVVDPLPDEFTGTYYGSSVVSDSNLPNDMTIGRISLTISSAGKVSGSFEDIMHREKCTFTGTGLLRSGEDGYVAKVSGKMGKKAVSFNVNLSKDRSAAFNFGVGKRSYYSFNCCQVYGKGAYGADDPVIADLEGKRVVADDVTFDFSKGGSALVTGTFVNPFTNKKFTSTVSAQLVRNAGTGTMYMPLVIKYKDGSGHPACYQLVPGEQEGDEYRLYWIDP